MESIPCTTLINAYRQLMLADVSDDQQMLGTYLQLCTLVSSDVSTF